MTIDELNSLEKNKKQRSIDLGIWGCQPTKPGRARCPTALRRRGDTPRYLPLCHSALKNERLEVNVRMNNSTLQLQLKSPTQTQPGGAMGLTANC